MSQILISPSILSADFGSINKEIQEIEDFADMIHIDVMDGHFVPNLTFGAPVLNKIKSKKPLDVHLMIENPENFIEDFAKAGANIISVHIETCNHLHRIIQQIKSFGIKASVAINPATSIETIIPILEELDMVILMTVNPGFGGQKFIDLVLPKIEKLRKLAPNLDIEVDGGINDITVKKVVKAGANVIVAGSYIFGSDNKESAINNLRVL